MRMSARRLTEGEYVVVSTRTHAKALIVPVLLFIMICGVAGFVAALIPYDLRWLTWVVVAIAAMAVARLVLWPFANWLSASYTITNRRLTMRRGVFTRVGHDIPLQRIHDVSYQHGLVDRVLGCGTLIVSSASEPGQVVLPDVPSVEQIHLSLTDLLMDLDEEYGDATAPEFARRNESNAAQYRRHE